MAGLSAISCHGGSNLVASLAAGANACTATYTTTAADVTNKAITNTGTAVGTPPTGPNLTATSTVTIPLAAIGIVKSASIFELLPAAGTAITYTYVVTNAGGAPLTDVTVTDPMAGLSAIDCGGGSNVVASLAAGVSVTCTATYTTTAADVTNKAIINTGTVVATPPSGPVLEHHVDGVDPAGRHRHREVGQPLELRGGGRRRRPTPMWSPIPAPPRSPT